MIKKRKRKNNKVMVQNQQQLIFSKGDFVFSQSAGYGFYPAKISNINKNGIYTVQFIGYKSSAKVPYSALLPFNRHTAQQLIYKYQNSEKQQQKIIIKKINMALASYQKLLIKKNKDKVDDDGNKIGYSKVNNKKNKKGKKKSKISIDIDNEQKQQIIDKDDRQVYLQQQLDNHQMREQIIQQTCLQKQIASYLIEQKINQIETENKDIHIEFESNIYQFKDKRQNKMKQNHKIKQGNNNHDDVQAKPRRKQGNIITSIQSNRQQKIQHIQSDYKLDKMYHNINQFNNIKIQQNIDDKQNYLFQQPITISSNIKSQTLHPSQFPQPIKLLYLPKGEERKGEGEDSNQILQISSEQYQVNSQSSQQIELQNRKLNWCYDININNFDDSYDQISLDQQDCQQFIDTLKYRSSRLTTITIHQYILTLHKYLNILIQYLESWRQHKFNTNPRKPKKLTLKQKQYMLVILDCQSITFKDYLKLNVIDKLIQFVYSYESAPGKLKYNCKLQLFSVRSRLKILQSQFYELRYRLQIQQQDFNKLANNFSLFSGNPLIIK